MRVVALVSGRVQGVGFRWWARDRARLHRLAGHAVNLPDGRVEVDIEGPHDDVAALLSELRTGPRSARVVAVATRRVPPRGAVGFDIG